MSPVTRSKLLSDFLPSSVCYQGNAETVVTGISADSRQVVAGDLFVAQTGFQVSGTRFIDDARQKGAGAVLTNDPGLEWKEGDLPLAYLPGLDKKLSLVAGTFYDSPSARLSVTGITGTNGKTSCCYWYAWICNELGKPCGQIGTLGAGYQAGSEVSLPSTGMTTPDAARVQALLAEIEDAGATATVMEVSSHGLDQGRVEAVEFEAAIFTNLTQDHLDYHKDMDEYFLVKASLFERPELQRAVLNLDDPTFDRLAFSLKAGAQMYSYSLFKPTADLYFQSKRWTNQGAEVTFDGRWGQASALVPVIGEYNLANLLAVMTALLSAGFELDAVVESVQALPPVPGRMQLISSPDCPRVLVDYAHTPDAVVSALNAVRPQVSGQLIAVLGCGGDRDREKRPLMGKYASENSDRCWFTSDNPRSEDPAEILSEMAAGAPTGNNFLVEEDRGHAIEQAIRSAGAEDLVVVLGKGHEEYQEISGERIPFSDSRHAEGVLAALNKSGGSE